jgi:hypothetical protein
VTISELGSLGEFVASVAVLISLVVLIFQIRGAKAEFSSQTTRDLKSSNNQAFYQLTSQPGLVDLHIRGQRDFQSLSETEAHTWMTWLFTWITQTEEGWKERERGVPNMEFVDGYLLGVALVLRSEGGSIVWPRLRVFFDEGFSRELEAVIRKDDTTHLDLLFGSAPSSLESRTPS